MKKMLAILMSIMLVGTVIAGCGSGDAETPGNGETQTNGETPTDGGSAGKDGFEIALITDKGNIDDKSFNQGSWEGVLQFVEKNDITHKYYKPEEASDAGYLAAIDLAVEGGAKVIVTPGFLFEVAVYEAQTKYPEVKFILLDGAPHTADYATFKTEDNVASILYAEEQADT